MANWEKVFALHRALNNRRYAASMNDLKKELDCSEATFYRTLGFLRDTLRMPVIYDKIYKGYKYDPDGSSVWEIPGLWFTPAELRALIVLQKTAQGLQNSVLDTVIKQISPRLESLLKIQGIRLKDWNEKLKALTVGGRKTLSDVFASVVSAVLHKKKLLIDYTPLGKPVFCSRKISPQTLLLYKDTWYVDAYCHERNDLRTFSLNRIKRVAVTQEKCHILPRNQLDSYFGAAYGIFSGKAPDIAHIKFTDMAAHEIPQESWHPLQQGEYAPDGSYILKIPYGNSRELIMDILRWGEEAEVIQPLTLRKETAQIIKKMNKIY